MYTNDCLTLLAPAEKELGSVNSFSPGAISQSHPSNTIPVSEDIIYDAYHSTHYYQSVPHLDDNGQS